MKVHSIKNNFYHRKYLTSKVPIVKSTFYQKYNLPKVHLFVEVLKRHFIKSNFYEKYFMRKYFIRNTEIHFFIRKLFFKGSLIRSTSHQQYLLPEVLYIKSIFLKVHFIKSTFY